MTEKKSWTRPPIQMEFLLQVPMVDSIIEKFFLLPKKREAAETTCDMAWEQLHSGPWNSVLPVWHDAYSMSCFHVARLHCAKNELKEALRVLDLGLMMGGMLLREDLESAVESESVKLRGSQYSTTAGGGESGGEPGKRRVLVGLSDNELGGGLNLPKRSLCCKRVAKRSNVSMEAFLNEYFLSGVPVILTDCMNHWPARTKWNDFDYLTKSAGNRTVPVEVGKNYLSPEWKQELITFSEFLKRIQSNDSSPGPTTYLAQHPLFDQITELRKDIIIPDYCFTGGGEIRSLNAWFGPTGTVTPLQHDPHNNILAQKKHASGNDKKMVIYIEACESGSIFEGIMPNDMNIYVTTASNAQESSWGTYCPGMDPSPPPE